MSKYRLAAKPGLARAGRFVNTKSAPVILLPKSNVVKAAPKPQQGPATAAKSKSAVPIPIKRAAVPQTPKAVRAISPAQKANLRQNKASPLRSKNDRDIERHRAPVEKLKGIGKGRLLVMVACGPSILEADLGRLKDHPFIDIMTINRPDVRIFPTRYWAFCDQSQYTRSQGQFDNYKGVLLNAWSVRARHPSQVLIRNISGRGFSRNLTQGYYIGRSTTYANMQTAYWMDYDKTFIFGCDMCKPPTSDKLHFYGVNQDVDPTIRVKRFEKEAEFYSEGARILTPPEREKFVFCTAYNPWPFMEHFPRLDHRLAVEHIIQLADQMKQR